MSKVIRVSKDSTGAKKRLYKAVRLWFLYRYKSMKHGWFSKKYKSRYNDAHKSMQLMIIKILHRFGPFKYWCVQGSGSTRAIDLIMDRGLEFMVVVGDDLEDM